jgi:hypothetical protein
MFIFIEVSVHMCINIYVYTLFLKKIFNLIFSFFRFVELFVVHRKKVYLSNCALSSFLPPDSVACIFGPFTVRVPIRPKWTAFTMSVSNMGRILSRKSFLCV